MKSEETAPDSDAAPPTPPPAAPLTVARVWFVAGALLATLGFVMPWFRVASGYLWWYSGWELITAQDSVWAGLHLAVVAGLALGGYWLVGSLGRTGPPARWQ